MRPEPPANFRSVLLETRRPGPPVSSHSFRIAVKRNLERKPTQALFTIAGLALATGLLIIPNTLKSGIADILDNQWDVVQRQDLNLGIAEPSSVRILHEFERLPGVIHVEPSRGVAVRLLFQGRNRQIGLRSLDPGAQHSRGARSKRLHEITPESGSLIVLGETRGHTRRPRGR